MQPDVLQAVVDGISVALKSMHQDMHVLLLSFSNRIGIYSVRNCLVEISNTKCTSHSLDEFSSSIGPDIPTVQYVHFGYDDVGGTNSLQSGSASIFEGHDAHEVVTGSGLPWVSLDDKDGLHGVVSPTVPLSEVSDFMNAICRVGDKRDALLTALQALYEGDPSMTSVDLTTSSVPQVSVYSLHTWPKAC